MPKFNKIPQLAMGKQSERYGGMISQGTGWGVSQTPDPIGCDQMSMGEPMETSDTFLSSVLNHYSFQKVVETVDA